MPISYGDSSDSRVREWYQSNTKVTGVSAPFPSAEYGSPILITYTLDSDVAIASNSVDVEYSTNSGSTWSTCAADAGHASHDGVTGLAADADTETYTFVWDALTDVGASYDGTTIQVRVKANDGSSDSETLSVLDFAINMLPVVSFGSLNANLTSTTLIPYTITSNLTGGTYTLECDYSTDGGSVWNTTTPDAGHGSHSGLTSLSADTSYNFVWDVEADLGSSYSSTVQLRLRANNGSVWGNYGASSDINIRLLPTVDLTAPLARSSQGSPVLVVYSLASNRNSPSLSITCDYSIDGGGAWSTATALTGHVSHSGITSLSVSAVYTFAWDSSTDLTTAFQDTDVQVRIRANDGTNNSAYAASSDFEVDMLPSAPVLVSPATGYFDFGTDPQFIWEIPSDAGSDKLVFKFDVASDNLFSSLEVTHNSVDNPTYFRHEIDSAQSTKQGAEMAYVIKNYTVASDSVAVTYASLEDFHSEATLPTTLTNPQLLIVNKSDRRSFVDPTSISTTGFTIQRSLTAVTSSAVVDILIYAGSAGSFETYWVDLDISTATAYTLGVAPFDTDDVGNTIPGSITDLRPMILEGSDRSAYVTSASDTGFTINPSATGVAATATIRVCLHSDPTAIYQHNSLTVTQDALTFYDTDNSLDDDTNGGAAWPAYISGPIITATPISDRQIVVGTVYGDSISLRRSQVGSAAGATVVLASHSESDTKLPYYMPVSVNGVPDEYEGENARYDMVAADDPSDGQYFWRVTAGNAT